MFVMVWEDPPPAAPTEKLDHRRIAAALRMRPGRWARVSDNAPRNLPGSVTRGAISAYRPGGTFEAEIRPRGDALALWVRYVGPAA